MNIAEKKHRLMRYGIVKNKLRRLEEERLEILANGTNIVGVISDMPRGTDITDKVGNASVQLDMIDEEIKEVLGKLKELRAELVLSIDGLGSELQKDIMFRRYIMLCDFETIADSVHRTKRTVERVHGRALQKIAI